ncbi:hypothetical protein [Desulfurobacterium sp.]
MIKFIVLALLLMPSLSPAAGLAFNISLGSSFIDGSSSLYKDYPAYVDEEAGSFYSFFVRKRLWNLYYVRSGISFINGVDRLYFYQGDVYEYTLKGIYGSLGAGVSFRRDCYFLDAGVDGYFNLFQEVETPYSTYDTDVFKDFFPGIHLSIGRYLTGRFFLSISYDQSLTSVFRGDLDTAYWNSLSIDLGFEY